MNNSPKLDISAMMKGTGSDKTEDIEKNNIEDDPENTNTDENTSEEKIEETKDNDKKSIAWKISIWSIRKNKSKSQIQEKEEAVHNSEHKEMKKELNETLSDDKNSEKKPDENSTDKNEKESIDEINSKINKEIEQETKEKLDAPEEDENDSSELFWNYKSEFIEKEEEIIKEVKAKRKNFRERMKEPKTRKRLVIWLLLTLVGTIGALFILDPENHSVGKYKARITNNIKNLKNYINNTMNDEIVIPEIVTPIITDPVITEPEIIDPIVTDPVITDPIITDPLVKQLKPIEKEKIKKVLINKFKDSLLNK